MLVLHARELKYEMPASSVAQSSHPVGVRMSGAGRFVVCIDCRLSVEFPAGAHYDTIAKQFESHSCSVPLLSNDDDPLAKAKTFAPPWEGLNRLDFDQNATPMWVFDISTLAFIAVNDAAVNHYGYSRNEFLSMTLLDIRPSEEIVPLLRDVLYKGTRNAAKRLRRHKKKDGSLIDVEITHGEVLFKGCIAEIVTAVDVTGRLPVPSSDHGTQVPTDRRLCSGAIPSKDDVPPSRFKDSLRVQ
jgi:PAS domain S-box-containing protein